MSPWPYRVDKSYLCEFSKLLESFISHGIGSSLAIVVDWLLLVVSENLDSWETLNSEGLADSLVLSHIYCSNIYSSLKRVNKPLDEY